MYGAFGQCAEVEGVVGVGREVGFRLIGSPLLGQLKGTGGEIIGGHADPVARGLDEQNLRHPKSIDSEMILTEEG